MNRLFILDFGSGNTCRNNAKDACRMIDEVFPIIRSDPKRFVIKWQLFQSAGGNIPLNRMVFRMVYRYAESLGLRTTASVFDPESLKFLLDFDIPFIKIANQKKLRHLAIGVPEEIPVVYSCDSTEDLKIMSGAHGPGTMYLSCVSQYPASIYDYRNGFSKESLQKGISDHTSNWRLYREYEPEVYECHYMLPDQTGLDCGPFARTPEQLKEVIG